MKSLEALLKKGTEILSDAGIEEASLDAWLLLEYVTGVSRTMYFIDKNKPADDKEEEAYGRMIHDRAKRIPLQHLTHQAYFMGHEFYVNEHVLIPRQDTEVLVEEALKILKTHKNPEILDMCTGSGCILQSVLMEYPNARGVAVDISGEALEVAKRNAESLGVADRVCFVHSDLFAAEYFQTETNDTVKQYDMLLSNPPYIATGELKDLMEEVRLHDPQIALDGMEDGLYFYRKITEESVKYLKKGGYLLYEIGCTQGEAVSAIMEKAGYKEVKVLKDLANLDRVVTGLWNGI